MQYEVRFVGSTLKQLNKLPKNERLKFEGIIELLKTNPVPPNAVKLRNRPGYRIRFGNYRLIYAIEKELLIILVLKVAHRKHSYKK